MGESWTVVKSWHVCGQTQDQPSEHFSLPPRVVDTGAYVSTKAELRDTQMVESSLVSKTLRLPSQRLSGCAKAATFVQILPKRLIEMSGITVICDLWLLEDLRLTVICIFAIEYVLTVLVGVVF